MLSDGWKEFPLSHSRIVRANLSESAYQACILFVIEAVSSSKGLVDCHPMLSLEEIHRTYRENSMFICLWSEASMQGKSWNEKRIMRKRRLFVSVDDKLFGALKCETKWMSKYLQQRILKAHLVVNLWIYNLKLC